MNTAALLGLIADLYAQIQSQQQRIAELIEAKEESDRTSPPSP